MIHITELGRDYFKYDEAHHVLRGERSGQTFRLGQRVRVKIVRADPDALKIDLQLIDVLPKVPLQPAAATPTQAVPQQGHADETTAHKPKRKAVKQQIEQQVRQQAKQIKPVAVKLSQPAKSSKPAKSGKPAKTDKSAKSSNPMKRGVAVKGSKAAKSFMSATPAAPAKSSKHAAQPQSAKPAKLPQTKVPRKTSHQPTSRKPAKSN
jgi:ribonuclease R